MSFTFTHLPLLAATASLLFSGASAQTVCSQSTNNTVFNSGIGCGDTGAGEALQFLRRYSAETDCGSPNGHLVTSVTWGGLNPMAAGGAGAQPLSVRVYSIPSGADFLYANMTLLSSEEDVMLPDFGPIMTTVLSNPACVLPGNDTVLEIAKLTIGAEGHTFFPGANDLGQSSPSYFAANACGINEPTDYASIGFPNTHLVLFMEQSPLTGSKFCGPNAVNSTALSAEILATGSNVAADNDLTLQVKNLPNNSTGFFIISGDQFTVANPGGSVGHICIASFMLGRYNDSILDTGMTNSVSLALDLSQTPIQPGGSFAIAAGQTWNWQYWYRDSDMGTPTSNFSDAVSMTFQ